MLKQENFTTDSTTSNAVGPLTPTNSHKMIDDEMTDATLVHTKTTSLTTAFGLTRLMETTNDNVMMTSSDNDGSAFLVSNKFNHSPSNQQQSTSMTTSPILNQPKPCMKSMDEDEQTIFDDDPMEGDSQQQTAIIS